MEVKDFYVLIGGDYSAALRTLMNDNIARRFILKFKDDKTYAQLLDAFDSKDIELMFRCSHTLKGVVLNLGMKILGEKAMVLTDALRENSPVRTDFALLNTYLEDVKQEYAKVIAAVQKFAEQ